MKSQYENLEMAELIDKLKNNGCGELVDALLNNESTTYTRKGRLNKSGACRVLKVKTKQLEDMLANAKEILGDDLI